VWRRQHERFLDANIIKHDPYGGGSIMFGVESAGMEEQIFMSWREEK
jgi:hypothetical protein